MNPFLLVNTNRMKPAIAPVGLDYLGEALTGKGYVVDLLDLCFSEDYRKAIDDYFRKQSALAIGVTIRNTDDCYLLSQDFFLPEIREIVKYLKTKTDVPIILGGVGFSIMPEKILEYCELDVGIRGDGEETLPLLLNRIAEGRNYTDLPGLVYRASGGFVSNTPEYFDLNKLSSRRRKLLNNRRYFDEGGQGNIETKRGCTKRCIYCADPLAKGRKIRLRNPKGVLHELEALLDEGVNYFHFCDSEFNLPEDHAKAVCQQIISLGVDKKINWYAYCSPIPFSEELAMLMKITGCRGVDFGVDNGNMEMLKILGRDFGKDEIRNTARLCHKYSITFMFDLLLGGPGETRETVKETIELMRETEPDRVGVMVGVRIYPGTELGNVVLKECPMEENRNLQGKIKGNSDFFEPVFYVSSKLGEDIFSYVCELIAGDERFFFATRDDREKGYNYNQNEVLVEAIKKGYRGAYWDILRRLSTEKR
ncbi:MAG: radical SAM protein [bacterium]